jgi:hypothetical protein
MATLDTSPDALLSAFGPVAIYVPSTGNATTDTAALVAAHAALPSSGGTILLDAGPYILTADTVNFTKAVHLIGSGPSGATVGAGASFLRTGSLIQCASATGVAITVNGDGCTFEKLSLENTAGSTPTAGAGIQIATGGRAIRVVDCSFTKFWTCLEFINGYEWFVDRIHVFDPVKYGIRVRDVVLPDGGDGIIANSFIYAGPTNLTPTAGVEWESGGGLKMTGNKVNNRGSARFAVGLNCAVTDGISTSVLVVVANSFENVDYGVLVQNLGPSNTGTFSKLTIASNEILAIQYGVAISAGATGKISGVNITGNVGSGGSGLIRVHQVAGVDIGLNTATSGSYLVVGSSVTNLFIDGIPYTTAARPAAGVMRAGSRYYDTTLSKPVWSDGTTWRDAAGTSV